MPKTPTGAKRPADVTRNAVLVMKIATGQTSERTSESEGKNPHAVALGNLGGAKGGKIRAEKLSPEKRRQIAQKAADARWKRTK